MQLGASVSLEAIGCTVSLADVYERVTFPPETRKMIPMSLTTLMLTLGGNEAVYIWPCGLLHGTNTGTVCPHIWWGVRHEYASKPLPRSWRHPSNKAQQAL